MCEFSLPPSPNWYIDKGLCVGEDGTLIYPSCANGITILEPVNEQATAFHVKNIYPAHKSRVTYLSLSPDFTTSKLFVSSANDGEVKLWNAKTANISIAHNLHGTLKDLAVGVQYMSSDIVVSVGSAGIICVWNVKYNFVKSDSKLLKMYKPTCVSKCSHKTDIISVGTKNGVVLVLAVADTIDILFKVHGHDTEITSMSWCPTDYCNDIPVDKQFKRDKQNIQTEEKSIQKPSMNIDVVKQILLDSQNETSFDGNETVNQTMEDSNIFDIYKDHSADEFGHKKYIYGQSDDEEIGEVHSRTKKNMKKNKEDKSKCEVEDFMTECNKLKDLMLTNKISENDESLQKCEDDESFLNSTTAVDDSDIFDRFKDISVDEFGHSRNKLRDLLLRKNISEKNVSLQSCNSNESFANFTTIVDDSDIFDRFKDISVDEFGHPPNKLKDFLLGKKTSDNKDCSQSYEGDKSLLNSTTVSNDSDVFDCLKDLSVDEFNNSEIKPKCDNGDFMAECNKLKDLLLKKNISENDESTRNCEGDESFLNSTSVVNDSDVLDRFKDISIDELSNSQNLAESTVYEEKKGGDFDHPPDFLKEYEILKDLMSKKDDAKVEELLIKDKKMSNGNAVKVDRENTKNIIPDSDKKVTEDTFDEIQKRVEELKIDSKNICKNEIYFASGCKYGKICIWKWDGSLVASCNLNSIKSANGKKADMNSKSLPWTTTHWLSSSILLMAKNTHLLKCNFSTMNLKTKKFGCSIVHDKHSRGLFSISSSVIRNNDNWREEKLPTVWTIGQDRLLIGFSMEENKCIARYSTFGGYVYDMAKSPLDSSRIAIGSGDGMVRVWERSEEMSSLDDIRYFWNGVQGKVRSVSWHPTKEQCLAYATTEGRIGILDVHSVKPAKVLPPGLKNGAYHICWGNDNRLFCCGSGEFVVYNAANPRKDCEKINIVVQEQQWAVSTMSYNEDFLTIGSSEGAIALVQTQHPFEVISTSYPHKKSIQCVEWHPKVLLSENEISSYQNLLAVSASALTIVVLQYKSDEQKFEQYAQFSMHNDKVRNISWNPHHSAQLLSVSDDCSIQIWDVANKSIMHTIVGHSEPVLCALWCPMNSKHVISASEDHTIRVWDITKFPPLDLENMKKKQRKKAKLASIEGDNAAVNSETVKDEKKTINETMNESISMQESQPEFALSMIPNKKSKKHSCLSIVLKQLRSTANSSEGCRRLFKCILDKSSQDSDKISKPDYNGGYDYLRIYGDHEDIIELLEMEVNNHEETLNWHSWCLVKMLNGDLKSVLEKAVTKNKLNLSLLSLAPFVSLRFWKDMMSNYSTQLKHINDRDSSTDTLASCDIWNCLILLFSNSFEEACDTFKKNNSYAEALCAMHTRYANHLVNKCLVSWIEDHIKKQNFVKASECYLALGQLMEAAVTLGKSSNESDLLLAADIAKHAGNVSLAEGVKYHANLK